ncbi:MAG: hypothetical protein HOF69_03665 [Campylobacteraceae bacterium]|nr:hypothetical protein [Campylobacteraceae bacterium]MBT3882342.1 hypothetical protein [Campylobacteraceae bacterium]MBT4030553.1 hypothetical protein [Campylobacteraceae bacterium]MBT4179006.1 hypothetical protein [Campylobacteraceae bacterium]MBT4572334.1 hypothetical protein [Campylobacteraceae bacterium]
MSFALQSLLNEKESKLNLIIYGQEDETLKEQFPNSKIQYIEDIKKPFRVSPRSVDIIVLKNIFNQHQKNEALLKISYTALANAADIIIIEKKGTIDKTAMYELLENNEFRAANFIDIFPNYDLVMAKKMHMWGNGL